MSNNTFIKTYYDNDNTQTQEEYFHVNGEKEGEYKQ